MSTSTVSKTLQCLRETREVKDRPKNRRSVNLRNEENLLMSSRCEKFNKTKRIKS